MEFAEVKLVDEDNKTVLHIAKIPLAEMIDAGVIEWQGRSFTYLNSNTMGYNDIRFMRTQKYVLED